MIELRYSFTTDERYPCPVIDVYIGVNGFDYYERYRCLLDTGACVAVACSRRALGMFGTRFGAVDFGMKHLTGFGRDFELCHVKGLSLFKLCDDCISSQGIRRGISYSNLPVVLCDRQDMYVDFILPSSMFRFCRVLIDYCDGLIQIQSNKSLYKGFYNSSSEYAYVKCVR